MPLAELGDCQHSRARSCFSINAAVAATAAAA